MDHLYSSTVKVQRLQLVVADGQTATHNWIDQEGTFRCRLDLVFLRPGKDALPAYEAGVVPDRTGVMFCSAKAPILAGDRVVTVSGPVQGTFDIKVIPDLALDYASAHHIEVQVFETNQTLSGDSTFPSSVSLPEPEPEPTPPIEP